MPELLEVDTRVIPGNGGEVALYIAPGGYSVYVNGPDGSHLAVLDADTRSEALEAFWHPFACPTVPDVFSALTGAQG